MQKGTITLKQGKSKKTGNAYTAIQVKIGKWSALHFPTRFEVDYLKQYLQNNVGTVELEQDDTLTFTAGDYVYRGYEVESIFELRYIKRFLGDTTAQKPASSQDDGKINLDEPAEPFNMDDM